MDDAAAAAPLLGRDERLRGAVALLALGLAAGGAGELSYDGLKQRFRSAMTRDPSAMTRDPVDALAVMLVGCSTLFYQAEHGENPRCASFLDALLFMSTCVSGGYADRLAQTAAGKAIAAFAMTMGPALAASALGAPQGAHDQGRAIVERLDAIL
ncbi:hypothetical protein BE18_49500, partial [Sorangium cellulosum]